MMGDQLVIEHWDSSKDGELTAANMQSKLEKEGYQCVQYTFSAGTIFADHTHCVSKKDAIVSGEFQFGMYGKTVLLRAGDTIEVPKGVVHNASVVGNEIVQFIDATK